MTVVNSVYIRVGLYTLLIELKQSLQVIATSSLYRFYRAAWNADAVYIYIYIAMRILSVRPPVRLSNV